MGPFNFPTLALAALLIMPMPLGAPHEFDAAIRRAEQGYSKSLEAARAAPRRGRRGAAVKLLGVYEARLKQLTSENRLGEAQGVKDAVSALARTGETSVRTASKRPYRFGGHSYAYFGTPVTWHQARELCEREEGRQVVVDTPQELAFLDTIAGKHAFWVGATDEAEEGHWKWLDGRDADIAGRHVENLNGREHWATRIPETHEYNDYPSVRLGYVCEWDD